MTHHHDYLASPVKEHMEGQNPLFHAFSSFFDSSPRHIPPHYHTELEIIIPYECVGETFCAGKRYLLQQGQAHILPSDAVHAFRIYSPNHGRVAVLKFNVQTCLPLMAFSKTWNSELFKNRLNTLPVIYNGNTLLLTQAMEELIQLTRSQSDNIAPIAGGVSRLFAIIQALFDNPIESNNHKCGDYRIRRILDVIDRQWNQPLSLDKIAEQSALSKFHLCRYFKKATGSTLSQYLMELRVNRAADILRMGGKNVTETCYDCGFENLSYFITVFKKIMGKTPKQWKRLHSFRPVNIIAILILLFSFPLFSCSIDKASQLYQKGVTNWNTEKIRASIDELSNCFDADAQKIKALSFWRLTVFSFIDENKKEIKANALKTIESAEALEKINGSFELSIALKGMSFQILSSLGVPAAIKNGPKAAEMQSVITKNYPNSYWSRLIKGINELQAPSFAGGNIDSAMTTFKSMNKDYPDSSSVTIYLVLAYGKSKQRGKGIEIIDALIKKEPLNKWALKVRKSI